MFLTAQIKISPTIDSARLENQNYVFQAGRIWAKAGLVNLFHPTAPSLDLGVEYACSKKISVEVFYGFRVGQIEREAYRNHLYFDKYYKVWTSLRYVRAGRNRHRTTGEWLIPDFFAAELYFSRGNTREEDNFVIDPNNRKRTYIRADIDKWVYGFHLKGGYLWALSPMLEAEMALGLRFLRFQRNYTVFNTATFRGLGQLERLKNRDDRRSGSSNSLLPLLQFRLNYKLL